MFLVAGDSMGDVEMLGRALNRLVVARLNKPVLAEAWPRSRSAKAPEANWMASTINSAPAGVRGDPLRVERADVPDLEGMAAAGRGRR